MEKRKFIEEIVEQMKESCFESIRNEEDTACYTYDCNDGYISIVMAENFVDSVVVHDNDDERCSVNIELAVNEALEDVWEQALERYEQTEEEAEDFEGQKEYLNGQFFTL